MKIAYFIDTLWQSGGTERVLTTKLNWLASQPDIQVAVVTIRDNRPPFFSLDERIERVELPVNNKNLKAYTKALEAYLHKTRPDISVVVAGMATETLWKINDGSKKVLEFHYTKNFLVNFVRGLHSVRFRNLHILKMKWMQWQLARTAKKYDVFVGLTKKDVGLWGNPKNMTYVHNPLSFRSDKKSTCANKRIISVGSWTPAKGMDQLLEAFGPLAKDYDDWHIDLFGSGQDEQLLRSIIQKYNMENQVTLHSPVKNIGDYLVEASIYAFPSRSDGFGLVITEAMECGLPTVAMDCPCGPCEIVTERTGLVVPEQDIATFRAALKKLMDSEALRQEMGLAAQEEVKRFYPDNIMPQWLKIFNS